MEEAVTLAESMDARGHGRGRRSRYRPARWTTGAVVMTAVRPRWRRGCSWWRRSPGVGGLHPSTFPLTWPDAEPVLLATIALLAVPGLLPRQKADG